jgi:hypothetical protein
MKSITHIALAAAAAAALAAPAAADARKPSPDGGRALFKGHLLGHQVSTWHFEDPGDPNDPCNISRTGDGDQTIEFEAKDLEIGVVRPPRGRPNLLGTHGRPWVWSRASDPMALTATRNAHTHDSSPPPGPLCGDFGGPDDDTPVAPPVSDCGTREGFAADRLEFAGRDRVKLSSQEHGWGESREPYLLDMFDDCVFLLDGAAAEHNGWLLPTTARIPEQRLFDRRRRKLVISGHTIKKYAEGPATGQTIVAWNLRLTRIKEGS